MASSFFMILDDIATLLDDVAVMTKVAAKKTATLVGDDLAVGANQVNGVNANRELPVVMAVFWGSMINKVILVPLALLLSFFAPFLITPMLILGGIYLCFEGAEKVLHYFAHRGSAEDAEHKEQILAAVKNPDVDLVALEKSKIKGAVRTDLILSAEIIIISLGTMIEKSLTEKILALSTIAILMTVAIYGCVALIVKIDDLGFYLKKKSSKFLIKLGDVLIGTAPKLMRSLSVLGTLAMFSVGGSILVHSIHAIGDLTKNMHWSASFGVEMLAGLVAGVLAVGLWMGVVKVRKSV